MTFTITNFIHCLANNIEFYEPQFNYLLKDIRSKKSSQFLKGLTKLCDLIPNDQKILCNEQFISDTSRLSTKLVKKITLMKSNDNAIAAFNKVVEIVQKIVFKNWSSGHRPLNKVLKNESLAPWKSQIGFTILDEKGKLFIDNKNILYITPPKSIDKLASFIEQIQAEFTEKISHIQFQGFTSMTRKAAEKFLKNSFLIQMSLYPTTFQFSDEKKEFRISPKFLLNSSFLEKLALHHQNMKKHSYIDFSNISFNSFKLINDFFEAPNSLILDKENIQEVVEAAHFLQCDDILERCDTFLKTHIDSISGPDLIKWFCSEIISDLFIFRKLAKIKIIRMIKNCKNFEELIEILRELKNAPIKSLDLGSLFFLKDEDLEQIIKLFPNLEDLILKNCVNLTEKIGPTLTQLKQLKFLDLKGCQNIVESIQTSLNALSNLKIRMHNYKKEFLLNLIDLINKKIEISDSNFSLMELIMLLDQNEKIIQGISISSNSILELSKEFLSKKVHKTNHVLQKKIMEKLVEDASKYGNVESIDIQILVDGGRGEEGECNQKVLKESIKEFLKSKIPEKDFSISLVSNRVIFRIGKRRLTIDIAGTKDRSNIIPLFIDLTSFTKFLKKHGPESRKVIEQGNRSVDTQLLGYDLIIYA